MPPPPPTSVLALPTEDHPSGINTAESTEDDPVRVNLSEIEFNQLYDACYNRIYVYAKRRVGDHCLAEDITQEVFLRGWTTPPTYRTSTLMPWLYTIAKNLITSYFRSSAQRRVVSDVSDDIADPASLLHHVQEQAEARRITEAVLTEACPSDLERAILALLAEGLTIEAIARQLDLPSATVKSRLQRFRARCRKTEAARWAYADGSCG